jgi:hypothetical protein
VGGSEALAALRDCYRNVHWVCRGHIKASGRSTVACDRTRRRGFGSSDLSQATALSCSPDGRLLGLRSGAALICFLLLGPSTPVEKLIPSLRYENMAIVMLFTVIKWARNASPATQRSDFDGNVVSRLRTHCADRVIRFPVLM